MFICKTLIRVFRHANTSTFYIWQFGALAKGPVSIAYVQRYFENRLIHILIYDIKGNNRNQKNI